MKWIGSVSAPESVFRRRDPKRMNRRLKSSLRVRSIANLETLESRTLRSTIPLSGFPAGGFRSSVLDGTAPWEVSLLIDGQPVLATGYDESAEAIAAAPTLALNGAGPTWVAGIIGDTRLRGSHAATNEVDFYRIELPAGDHYALSLHALAQQFGSGLDPALSLFDSHGDLLASNDDALHPGALSDSEIYAGLNGGTYYVAVSAGGNLSTEPGGFNPQVPGSGISSRGTTGPYLLEVSAVSDAIRPEVVQISVEPGAHITEPLTQISVQFSEPMNLLGLVTGAELVGPGNTTIGLSATQFDSDSIEVTYTLTSRPLPGDYSFILHGSTVTDRADNPISGDDALGGFVVHFSIDTPVPTWQDTESNDTPSTAQTLGPLYSAELRAGVAITGSVDHSGDQDFYRFQVIRSGFYTFRLRPGPGSDQTGLLMIRDSDGQLLGQGFHFPGVGGSTLIRYLKPGEYLIHVNSPDQLASGAYRLTVLAANDAEVPLLDNGYVAPVISVSLSTHDGERHPENVEPEVSSPPVIVTGDAISYSVGSVPSVGSQPVGGPQLAVAGPAELAWVDLSSEQQVLPAGVVIRRQESSVTQYAVTSVSGSFLDPLPDAVTQSQTSLMAPRQLGAEIRDALHSSWAGDTLRSSTATEAPLPQSSGVVAESGDQTDSSDSSESHLATTPSGIAFGMVASLGVVSAATAPNRRRTHTWIHQAFELLGIDI